MSIAHDIIMFYYVIMLCHIGLISYYLCYTLIKVTVENCGRWEEWSLSLRTYGYVPDIYIVLYIYHNKKKNWTCTRDFIVPKIELLI